MSIILVVAEAPPATGPVPDAGDPSLSFGFCRLLRQLSSSASGGLTLLVLALSGVIANRQSYEKTE